MKTFVRPAVSAEPPLRRVKGQEFFSHRTEGRGFREFSKDTKIPLPPTNAKQVHQSVPPAVHS